MLSEVVESFSRLPGGSDALAMIRKASLTADEQRYVLERVRAMRPDSVAGFVKTCPLRDVLARREAAAAKKAEASAAVEHDYVPDGGRFPDALRAPPGHLDARVSRPRTWKPPPPPPGDPRELELARLEAHATFLRRAHAGHPELARLEAEAATLRAELARQRARGGLRLVTS